MSEKTILALVLASVLLGCGQSEPAADASSSESYMKDKVFMKQLEDRKTLRDDLLARRVKLNDALQAEKAKNPDSDLAKDLQKRLDACDAEFEKNRKETYQVVRERLLKKKEGGK